MYYSNHYLYNQSISISNILIIFKHIDISIFFHTSKSQVEQVAGEVLLFLSPATEERPCVLSRP